MKKIVIIVGSNNSIDSVCYKAATRFLSEIESHVSNVRVSLILCASKNILYCKGCKKCFERGSCDLDMHDDMSHIKEQLLESDLVIVISPVYANNIPGILKTAIDRITYWMHLLMLIGKTSIIIAVAHGSGIEYVINYLSSVMTCLGTNVIMSSSIVINNLGYQNLDERIETISKRIVKKVSEDSAPINDKVEDYYHLMRNTMINYIDAGIHNAETNHWMTSGMIRCDCAKSFLDSCS